jgi:hypothetical protein
MMIRIIRDEIYDSGYKAYHVNTDISEILVNNTNTNCFGNNGKLDKAQATFLPRDEWSKLTQEQKDHLIAKRRQERMNLNLNKLKPFQPKHQLNSHHVSYTVNIDDVIDYTVKTHEIGMNNDDDGAKASDSTDNLLAHMAVRSSSSGDIRHVLAAKQKSDKGKNQNVNASMSEPGTLKLGDTS